MKIYKNQFKNFDVDGIQDHGIRKGTTLIAKGIAGYHGRLENIIGWVLSIFRRTVVLKADEGNYYLQCASLKDWFNRVNVETVDLTNLDEDIHNPDWVANSIQSVRATIQHSLSILSIKEDEKVGQFRKSIDGKQPPDLISQNGVISNKNLYSVGFASCFHTSESRKEIFELIKQTRIKDHKKKFEKDYSSLDFQPCPYYTETYKNFYNNLVCLHEKLPGKPLAKSIKIYWNQRAEEILSPHFFHNPSVKIEDLVFAVVSGEEGSSSFQAQDIDFRQQLRFVGIGKEKIMNDLNQEVKRLSEEVFGENILLLLPSTFAIDNKLFADALTFTSRNQLRINLQQMNMQSTKVELKSMSEEEVDKYLANLCLPSAI